MLTPLGSYGWTDGNGLPHTAACSGSVSGSCQGCAVDPLAPLTGNGRAEHPVTDRDEDDVASCSADTVNTTPAMVTVRLSDVVSEVVDWLWDRYLPAGKIVTLDGDPGTGKSTLSVDFAAHVSTGTAWPDGAACPVGDVLILSAEDGLADTIRPRLDAAAGDPARVHCLTAVRYVTEDGESTTRPPTLADIATIRDAITTTGARLLIVDVLMAYLPGKVDSHRDQDVRAVLHRVSEMATDTGCTVLLLRHLTKSGTGSPMYRGGGSIGIVGAARAGFVVAPDPDDDTRRVLAPIKCNLCEEPPSLTYRLVPAPGSHVARVSWGETTEHRAADLLRAPPDGERSERTDVAQWLRKYLTDNGRTPSAEVKNAAHTAGFSDRTMARARQSLRVAIAEEGYPRVTYWSLPDSRANSTQHAQSGTTGTTGPDQHKGDDGSDGRASRATAHGEGTTGTTGMTGGSTPVRDLPVCHDCEPHAVTSHSPLCGADGRLRCRRHHFANGRAAA